MEDQTCVLYVIFKLAKNLISEHAARICWKKPTGDNLSFMNNGVAIAGKCDLFAPPTSWLVTTGIGITKWATAGVATDGDNFCITGNPATIVEVDYHINLGGDSSRKSSSFSRSNKNLWDNQTLIPEKLHMIIKIRRVIKAALASGDPATVARTIERTTNLQDWAITVLQVDFTNPETHLNASSFADPNVWCSVYIGIDPSQGFSYLFEIQLGKFLKVAFRENFNILTSLKKQGWPRMYAVCNGNKTAQRSRANLEIKHLKSTNDPGLTQLCKLLGNDGIKLRLRLTRGESSCLHSYGCEELCRWDKREENNNIAQLQIMEYN
ncbi:hypothetical protein NECAME_06693 [Necator americanus]|uniref:Uncharacterized protein n=1 Tax=Necator americanus TaxID=51031 RepID=W2TT34_NECAM|nr:hypothetical protein NECAME_06693 [Necator americanus]ETN84809.1 hypothetical protein NECAME_06693 [Necator americanus]